MQLLSYGATLWKAPGDISNILASLLHVVMDTVLFVNALRYERSSR